MSTPTAAGTERRAPSPWRMLWVTFAWGSCFVAISVGLQDAPLLWLAALRALVAGAALLILTVSRRAPVPRDVRSWTLIGVLGVVNVAIAYAAMFGGTIGLTTGVASVLANIQPVLILLPAWWLYRERPSPRSVAAMLTGLAGLLLIVLPAGAGTGAWLSLTAAAAVTAGTLISRAVRADPFLVAAVQLLLGGGILLVAAAIVEGPRSSTGRRDSSSPCCGCLWPAPPRPPSPGTRRRSGPGSTSSRPGQSSCPSLGSSCPSCFCGRPRACSAGSARPSWSAPSPSSPSPADTLIARPIGFEVERPSAAPGVRQTGVTQSGDGPGRPRSGPAVFDEPQDHHHGQHDQRRGRVHHQLQPHRGEVHARLEGCVRGAVGHPGVQQAMGHSSLQVTELYSRSRDNATAGTGRRLSAFLRGSQTPGSSPSTQDAPARSDPPSL